MPLRLIPIFVTLACAQLGLYLFIRTLFFPGPEQRWGRRLAAAWGLFSCASLPLYGYLVRNGVQLDQTARYLVAYPILSWTILSIPLVIVLGAGMSLARRWPVAGAGAAPPPRVEALGNEPVTEELLTPATARGQPLLEGRRILLARAATGLLGGAALLGIKGVEEAESLPEITRHDLLLPGLHHDLDGLTVLQLSDIHSGALITEERMSVWAAQAAALGADIVVFTGDLLDGSGRAAAPYSRAFSGLHGKLGTFAILGNHDYFAGRRFAVRAVGDAGQTLLVNSGARLGRGRGALWIGGTDDPIGDVDAEKALRGADPAEPKILLAHRPGLFGLCAAAGADLVLSGHTHGGQIALSASLSPARLITRYTMGQFREGRSQLYVHRGMGTVGAVPLRLGSRPELALLTLRGS